MLKRNFSISKLNIIVLFIVGLFFISSYSYLPDEDIKGYYDNINEADYSIVKKEYNQALLYFDRAFELKKSPFAKDIYNAGMCALLLKKQIAFDYFEKLAQKGVLLENLPLEELKALNKEKFSNFEKQYTITRDSAMRLKNIRLKKELEKMSELDQVLAREKDFDKTKRPKFTQSVFINSQRIIDIINEFGFPNEDLVGIEYPNSGSSISTILFHYAQTLPVEKYFEEKDSLAGNSKKDFGLDTLDFKSLNLINILKQEVLNGNFPRESFANLGKYFANDKYGLFLNLLVDKRIGRIVYSSNQIATIDSARREIYLDSHSKYVEQIDSLNFILKNMDTYMNSMKHERPFLSKVTVHTLVMFFTDSIEGSNYFDEQLKKYPAMVELNK